MPVNEGDVDVEEILRKQDDAMALLDRLRLTEPSIRPAAEHPGGGRRQFRRWPTPPGVTLEIHDGQRWCSVNCTDMGVGGARIAELPAWLDGPAPARLKANDAPGVLVLSDIMWRDSGSSAAGLGFDFLDSEEHELWATSLIDALLSEYSLT